MIMQRSNRSVYYFLFCLAVYVAGVAGYAVWNNIQTRQWIFTDIDRELILAAKSLKFMVAPDFHDRALDEKSISYEEEIRNREAVSNYTFSTEFKWLYTLIEKEGEFYFAAPTVTEEEARRQKRWYFHSYKDIPADFVQAFKENKVKFVTYTDQWGTFRSVALPQASAGGRRYLACADYDISFVESLLRKNLWTSIWTSLFFFFIMSPFVFTFRIYCRALKSTNQELLLHQNRLEKMVGERTEKLQKAKEEAEGLVKKLKQALDEVKTLKGLLPICSNCKKIRDDQGYWHQVEAYIHERTDAEFSHSLCPDCFKGLYPKIYQKLKDDKPRHN